MRIRLLGAFGLSVAAQTLAGQCIGAGEKEEAQHVTRRMLRSGYLLMSGLAVV